MSILKLYSTSFQNVPKAEVIQLITVLSEIEYRPLNRIQVNEYFVN